MYSARMHPIRTNARSCCMHDQQLHFLLRHRTNHLNLMKYCRHRRIA